jgi:hypothetical protein
MLEESDVSGVLGDRPLSHAAFLPSLYIFFPGPECMLRIVTMELLGR